MLGAACSQIRCTGGAPWDAGSRWCPGTAPCQAGSGTAGSGCPAPAGTHLEASALKAIRCWVAVSERTGNLVRMLGEQAAGSLLRASKQLRRATDPTSAKQPASAAHRIGVLCQQVRVGLGLQHRGAGAVMCAAWSVLMAGAAAMLLTAVSHSAIKCDRSRCSAVRSQPVQRHARRTSNCRTF
jgi:hypothetical protein